jgi:hypothetical protein
MHQTLADHHGTHERRTVATIPPVLVIALLTVTTIALLGFATPAAAQDLDEHLQMLRPLAARPWTGGYVDSPEIVITLEWEEILAGKALRCTRRAPEVDFTGETTFYWDPERDAIAFIALNNRGIVGSGTVQRDGEAIVLLGRSRRPDQVTEFRTTYELLEDGRLRDTFVRKQGETWVTGHVQEFTAGN